MITIKFFETSEVDEYINNTKAEVEDIKMQFYKEAFSYRMLVKHQD